MKHYLYKTISLWLFILIMVTSCKQKVTYTYKQPLKRDDGLAVSSLTTEGMDSTLIINLVKDIRSGEYHNVHSLLVIRNNKLVLDEYFNHFSVDTKHKIWSCTKSFTSVLVGQAIDKGSISHEDESIFTYIPEYQELKNNNTQHITIKHALTMTAGLQWNGNLNNQESDVRKCVYSPDWIRYYLSKPKVTEGGKIFNYCDMNTILLSPVVKNSTGKSVTHFAEENLFRPLKIKDYEWHKASEFWTKTQDREIRSKKPEVIKYDHRFMPLINTATGLKLIPRDLIKIGLLYLNKGNWEGNQIVSEAWVEKSVRNQFNNPGYGYFWKIKDFRNSKGENLSSFYASGFGGQFVFVIPDLNLVICLTQGNYKVDALEIATNMIERFILPAIKNNIRPRT